MIAKKIQFLIQVLQGQVYFDIVEGNCSFICISASYNIFQEGSETLSSMNFEF